MRIAKDHANYFTATCLEWPPFKKGDIRVYAIKDENGHVIILGGKKGDQDEDIVQFRSLKKRYLDSKK